MIDYFVLVWCGIVRGLCLLCCHVLFYRFVPFRFVVCFRFVGGLIRCVSCVWCVLFGFVWFAVVERCVLLVVVLFSLMLSLFCFVFIMFYCVCCCIVSCRFVLCRCLSIRFVAFRFVWVCFVLCCVAVALMCVV